jgi:arylsulfatase A-like enzyme
VGANGQNSSTRTPNLDKLAARGTNFTSAVTNQPVCAPSRSVLMTSRYATETGVWQNGLGLREDLPTLAGELRKAGYTANYLGKWHLAPDSVDEGGGLGFVKPEHRGGFLDFWEGSNVLELTSHPYEGTMWDGDGKEIVYKDQYRVDFLTDRAERFLRQKHDKPFLLFISQLEPHQQNDMGGMVGPKGSAARFINASVPLDLRNQPGDWHKQLPDYYGACESIDASVGRIRRILEEENLSEDTVFVFVSDHGCHFMTRNEEYKRSPHNSSVRVPLIVEGPGFEGPLQVSELVGLIHLAPTLLDAAGVAPPESWRGKSILPLVNSAKAREEWPNEELIQISESCSGRAIKTKDWTYFVVNATNSAASSIYHEHQLYSQRDDPFELVNLSGRKEYRQTAKELRERLKKLIVASGDPGFEIETTNLYP